MTANQTRLGRKPPATILRWRRPHRGIGRTGMAMVFAVLCLAGCAHRAPVASPLQRYQESNPLLVRAGVESGRVASDSAALERDLRFQRFSDARSAARQLGRHANDLASTSRALRSRIHGFGGYIATRRVRRYFFTVEGALNDDTREALTLIAVAHLALSDPTLDVGRDASTLSRLDRRARTAASAAVAQTTLAERWKREHAKLFRYTPVRGHR